MYFNTRVVDRVFPALGRNYPTNLVGGAPAGQVSALYHDTRLAVRLDNGLCAEHPLQVSPDSGENSEMHRLESKKTAIGIKWGNRLHKIKNP